VEQVAKKDKKTFTDHLRVRFKGVLDPIARALNGIGLMPNTVTILGLVGNTIGAYLLATGHIGWGGVIVLLMGPIDALDGTMARLRGEPSLFGAFVDSVTDRYSELVIFAGLLVYFLTQANWLGAALAYFAAAGSVLVSYVKSRAQTLGFDCETGILTRAERYLVLAPLLVINQPMIALWIIAILANLTAFQRILYVRAQARASFHAQAEARPSAEQPANPENHSSKDNS
jgi:CDP-diacylglycerol--glycerol-3-phosphate 3-phosphatidyltransferase